MNPNEPYRFDETRIIITFPPAISLSEAAARLRSTAHIFEMENQIKIAQDKHAAAKAKHEATYGVKCGWI